MAVTSSGLSGSFILPAPLNVRSNDLSAHERTQWDAIGFESWFEAAARRVPKSNAPEGPDSGVRSQDVSIGDFKGGPRSGGTAAYSADEANQAAIAGIASSSVRAAESETEAATVVGQGATSMMLSRLSSLNEEGSVEGERNVALGTAQRSISADATGPRVTVTMSDKDVSVWIQNSQLDGEAMVALRGLISKELSWSGLALAGLKINGHELVQAIGMTKSSNGKRDF